MFKFTFVVFLFSFLSQQTFAACTGTTRTWQGTTAIWTTAANWTGSDVPNTAGEDVVVQTSTANPNIGSNQTVGCVTVNSGILTGSTAGAILTVTGESFTALTPGTLNITNATNTIRMGGTAAQTIEVVNNLQTLNITNTTNVTIKNNFNITTLSFTGSGTTYIEGSHTVTNAITIPVGHTVVLRPGAILTSTNNLTVNGNLTVEDGAELRMLSTRVLSVAATGSIWLDGTSTAPAVVTASTPTTFFTFNMAGTMTANHFVINKTTAGLNLTGTVIQLDNGSFQGIVNNSYGIVLGAAAILPATMTGLKFYNSDNVATPRNFNASTYNTTTVSLFDYSGSVSGATYENDTNNKISWITASSTTGCGPYNRNWVGTTVTWATAANWSGTNFPDNNYENAVITTATANPNLSSNTLVSCLDVQSGTFGGTTANMNLTVTGDYFDAPTAGMLNFTQATMAINMDGAGPQTLTAANNLMILRNYNKSSLTVTGNFNITTLTMVGTGTTNLQSTRTITNAVTVPVGHTLVIKSGAIVTFSNNLTVNGNLIVEAGAELRMASTRVLSVAASGTIELSGSSGNPAVLTSSAPATWFTLTVAGSITANHFIITRTTAAGLNVTGTITQLDNGEFHGVVNNGYSITLGAATVAPATLNTLSFYNDDAVATPRNINATAYNLTTITLQNYTGSVSGATYEIDPNAKIAWGTAGSTSGCAGTDRTWSGSTVTWITGTNWFGSNAPDSASENAVIISNGTSPNISSNITVSCVDVQSGVLSGTAAATLTIVGDYFKSPYNNSLNFTNAAAVIAMDGSSPQTFEAVGDIRDLRILNPTSVTLQNSFRILSDFTFVGNGTTYVEGDVTVTNAMTIPVGHTVVVKNGASLTASAAFAVNGTLKIEAGGEVKVANGITLTISSSGSLQLLGASGNPARLSSPNSSSWFNLTMQGSFTANYFVITRAGAAGLNLTGTATQIDNGEFRGIVNNGYAMTFGAAASIPSVLNTIGFFNDDAVANPRNINASTYNLTTVTVDQHSGSVAGATFENDTNNKITWGTSAATVLTITNDAETNEPTATLAVSTAVTMAEFAFTLSKADTATDITQVTLTLTGTATSADLSYVRAYYDAAGSKNCDYNAGVDTQIGGDLVFSGSPATTTLTIPAGGITTNSSTQQGCLHIRASTNANPTNSATIKFGILNSSDVVNSQSYGLSTSSGVPIESAHTTIINTANSIWSGVTSTLWNLTTNWTGAIVPTSTRSCQIGVGTNVTQINTATVSCANATITSGATIDYNNTSNVFQVYNTLDVDSGVNFTNATTGVISMLGTANQSFNLSTAFPGNVIINNTGIVGNNKVSVTANSTIDGTLTCTAGVLEIPNGITLTVKGNITIQTGCTISITSGGTLALANNRTLTVNSGGILNLVGNATTSAKITSENGSSAYNIIVNGTISARYYVLERLGTNGLSIESGATIDATNYLQNGSFIYPVNSSTTLLKLKRQIPGNALSNMNFDLNGSSATSITNIDTTGASAGTLTITTYTGNVAGASYDVDPTYNINWTGASNTIDVTQEATGPASVNTGTTNNMGRFGFEQTNAGVSYSDANVTSLKLTLTGTGTAADISQVRLYYDSACSGSSGTLIGTGTFSGSPATVTFSITPGDFIVPAGVITTTKRCIYVEYDINSNATNNNTVGVAINAGVDIVNSQNYGLASGTPAPINLGTASTIIAPSSTTWTGTTSTAWTLSTNWTAGVPTPTKACNIPNVANDPTISSGTATCKNVNITTGILTLSGGATLETYGDFTNTGTFTQTGNLSVVDGGANIDHNINSSSTIANLHLNKTGTGIVNITGSSVTINSLNFSSSTTTLSIGSGKKLVLPNGVTITQGTLDVGGNGTLEIGNTQTITVSGGTFKTSGTSDGFPQNATTKGKITVQGGAGTFGFTATSGTINLVGFHFDRLNTSGLNIGGTTVVSNINGGQLTNLSTSYASVKAIQLNTTGTLPLAATNVAWVWGNFNSFDPANGGTPSSAQAYQLVSSTGCGSQTIDFTGWSGDWFESQPTFNVQTKVSASGCTINMGAAASAISLLSFNAVPYNAKIDVRWTTNNERNHLGFNLYRTTEGSTRFQQINKELIRNLVNLGANQGKYRFIDEDVTNGTRYYYYLEDLEKTGKKTLHGPVNATPLANLGNPPATDTDENSGTNPQSPNPGGGTSPAPIPNTGYQNLGNGVVIQNQTSKAMRLEITPPMPSFSASQWNNQYQDVSISGYSKMTDVGKPELPEKELLIEVNREALVAQVISNKVTETTLSGHLISPAPDFSLNKTTNVFEPSYVPDSVVYSANTDFPTTFTSITAQLVKAQNKTYLRLRINPLLHNPVANNIRYANKIVLDIGFNGSGWGQTSPQTNTQLGPYNVANTLRIDYEKAGLYQINYSDLESSQVEGPFENVDVNQLRLYYQDREIPLEIHSNSGQFSGTDYIRFYLPYNASLMDKKNQAILASTDILGEGTAVKRIEVIDADPAGQTAVTQTLTTFTKTLEQNYVFIDGETLKDNQDHYFYAQLMNYVGFDNLTIETILPEIDNTSNENVVVKYYVKGMEGYFGNLIQHHVQFFLDGNYENEALFEENSRQVIKFEVPADRLKAGLNRFDLKVMGTYAPAGDYDRVLVDKVEVIYRGNNNGVSNHNLFVTKETESVHELKQFTTNTIHAFDITEPLAAKRLNNMEISSPDTGVSFNAKFFVDSNVDSDYNKAYAFVQNGSYLKPRSLSLTQGSELSLKDSSNHADMLIIGHNNLLEAVRDLVDHRASQGLDVMTLTYDQIYADFSYGLTDPAAVRKLIDSALNSWVKRPRFVLFLGDGTQDPLDHNVKNLSNNLRSTLEKETAPMNLTAGRFIDFATDNYFASTEISHLPRLAVGRLPSNDPDKLKLYVDKVINYENSDGKPDENVKKITFFADEELGYYERFNELSQNMIVASKGFTTTLYDRTEIGSASETKSKILEEFNHAPLIISLLGHGAFDRFGANLLSNTDANTLTNDQLPIVATWSCESSYFYDANKTYKSLGEELIFSPNGGAIAFLGSTTQTTPPAQAKLAQNFYTQLSNNINAPYNGTRLGEILYLAKLGVGSGHYEKDIVNSFIMIGDPSLRLPAKLYPQGRNVAGQEAEGSAPSKKSGGLGCSAHADDGIAHQSSWMIGLIELLLYYVLGYIALRAIRALKSN